jgi:hypothetical protein
MSNLRVMVWSRADDHYVDLVAQTLIVIETWVAIDWGDQ